MDRRAFLAGSFGFLAIPLAAEAQPATKPYRVGLLAGGLPPSHRAPLTEVRLPWALPHGTPVK
jgi:hypothetical protein